MKAFHPAQKLLWQRPPKKITIIFVDRSVAAMRQLPGRDLVFSGLSATYTSTSMLQLWVQKPCGMKSNSIWILGLHNSKSYCDLCRNMQHQHMLRVKLVLCDQPLGVRIICHFRTANEPKPE